MWCCFETWRFTFLLRCFQSLHFGHIVNGKLFHNNPLIEWFVQLNYYILRCCNLTSLDCASQFWVHGCIVCWYIIVQILCVLVVGIQWWLFPPFWGIAQWARLITRYWKRHCCIFMLVLLSCLRVGAFSSRAFSVLRYILGLVWEALSAICMVKHSFGHFIFNLATHWLHSLSYFC